MKTHIRLALISILVTAVLGACGPSQAELDDSGTQATADDSATQTAKAPTATYTPTPFPTATQTPIPTATPEPTNTPTPIPTDTPTPTPILYEAGEFVDGKLVLTRVDSMYLMDLGQSWHDDGYYSSEIYMYNAMLEYSLKPDLLAEVHAKLGQDYAALGHYDLAIEHYLRVLDLDEASEDVTSYVLNETCWIYTITNRAQDALPYCEESVALELKSANLDSRGITYAMLGKYPEAASDFKAALELGGWPNDEMKAERQEWITALESGTNPITNEVLERELVEQAPLTLDPMYTGDLKLSYLRSIYEEMGYVFTETTFGEKDIPGLSGTLIDGICMSMIFLAGDEHNIVNANSYIDIEHCGDDETSARVWQFNYGFVRDYDEWAWALIWQAADWYYVIEGDKQTTDLSPTFGGYQFTVERTEVNGTVYVQVIAKPAAQP